MLAPSKAKGILAVWPCIHVDSQLLACVLRMLLEASSRGHTTLFVQRFPPYMDITVSDSFPFIFAGFHIDLENITDLSPAVLTSILHHKDVANSGLLHHTAFPLVHLWGI